VEIATASERQMQQNAVARCGSSASANSVPTPAAREM